MQKILLEEETYKIRGAVFEVYRQMGHGFLESVYQECLENEFIERGFPFEAQPELILKYKGKALSKVYKPDFICFDEIIVEIKAVKELAVNHKAQVINYLKATGKRVGLLVNFGSFPKAVIERVVL